MIYHIFFRFNSLLLIIINSDSFNKNNVGKYHYYGINYYDNNTDIIIIDL